MITNQFRCIQVAKSVRLMSSVTNTVHPRIAGRKRFYKTVDVKNLEHNMVSMQKLTVS